MGHAAHLVPIGLWKLHGGRASLDAAAVHEDMDFAHFLHRVRKYTLDAFKVRQVTLDDLDTSAESGDLVARRRVGAAGTLHEADVRAGLRERERTRLADACKRGRRTSAWDRRGGTRAKRGGD